MTYEGTYKKMQDGTWGAYIDCGYGKNALPKPVKGSVVKITTKSGEVHERIVRCIATDYASGCKVRLTADEAIAKKATERYNAKVASSNQNKMVYSNGKKMSQAEFVMTEGYGW